MTHFRQQMLDYVPTTEKIVWQAVNEAANFAGITFGPALGLPSQPPRATVKHLHSLGSIPTEHKRKNPPHRIIHTPREDP